jgi:hypothetical protein
MAPLARTAVRLHPRSGAPSPGDSSVGGPLLWPAAELWPYGHRPHEPDGIIITWPKLLQEVRLAAHQGGRAESAARWRLIKP